VDGDVFQASPGGFRQHEGEREAEDRYAGGEQERSAQAQRGLQHREQEDPWKTPSLPTPAEIPGPVARMLTGYN
jgi:hypothetical protein